MIKKLFSKRSGFTLVEIVVAFAVFAIMASMIMQILNLVLYQKKDNQAFDDKMYAQEELIAKNSRTGEYDESKKDGTMNFDFGEDGKIGIDYMMKTPDDEAGLTYYIGPGSDGSSTPLSPTPSEPMSATSAGSQLDRMDTRITGTSGFESINVSKVIKDTSYSGPGARYLFEVSANGKKVTNEIVPYAQYKLYFCMSDKYDAAKSSVTYTDDDGSTYTKKVPQKAQIIDGGYINGGWDSSGNMSWASVSGHIKPFSDTSCGNGTGNNYYNVKILNDYTVRVGSPYVNDHSDSGVIGTKKRGVKFLSSQHTRFYLIFAEDPKLTTESFGADFGGNVVKKDSGRVEYSRVPILDKDGNATGDYNVNIYGAFQFEKVKS